MPRLLKAPAIVHPEARPSLITIAFASVGGAGYFPVASGTVGSFVALVLYWFIPQLHVWWVMLPAIVLVCAAGIPASSAMERYLGPDPSAVVIDELVGMWISMLFVPVQPILACIAFFAFRVFDIIKPPPARQFDAMKGGFGIMMDDVAAGVYANLVVRIAAWLLPGTMFITP